MIPFASVMRGMWRAALLPGASDGAFGAGVQARLSLVFVTPLRCCRPLFSAIFVEGVAEDAFRIDHGSDLFQRCMFSPASMVVVLTADARHLNDPEWTIEESLAQSTERWRAECTRDDRISIALER